MYELIISMNGQMYDEYFNCDSLGIAWNKMVGKLDLCPEHEFCVSRYPDRVDYFFRDEHTGSAFIRRI